MQYWQLLLILQSVMFVLLLWAVTVQTYYSAKQEKHPFRTPLSASRIVGWLSTVCFYSLWLTLPLTLLLFLSSSKIGAFPSP
jgi:hypothetical protein